MTTDELVKILWEYNHLNHKLEKADAILALGSSDIRTAEHASKLFLDGYSPMIIFSGGGGAVKKWSKPEAEVFAERAEQIGIPRDSMILEIKSTNTGENIAFTKKLLEEKGIILNRVILVQKPYMERRAYATFKKHFARLEPIMSSPDLSFEEYVAGGGRSMEQQISILVGDTQRIRIYAEKGFMIPQEIPEEVVFAYRELARRGYDKEMLPE
jgi:uncharacterized SAM-binding protein YcdF (DUF218 family)